MGNGSAIPATEASCDGFIIGGEMLDIMFAHVCVSAAPVALRRQMKNWCLSTPQRVDEI
jgi:hypothetical protein